MNWMTELQIEPISKISYIDELQLSGAVMLCMSETSKMGIEHISWYILMFHVFA